jgi:catechol 2,3-dioxygenase-like lactoylglutathione lyase family enzyme
MIQIRKIDHLVLRSDNVAGMVRFYHEVFGCEVERELPAVGLTQLRAGNALIDIVAVNSELGTANSAAPAERHPARPETTSTTSAWNWKRSASTN